MICYIPYKLLYTHLYIAKKWALSCTQICFTSHAAIKTPQNSVI